MRDLLEVLDAIRDARHRLLCADDPPGDAARQFCLLSCAALSQAESFLAIALATKDD